MFSKVTSPTPQSSPPVTLSSRRMPITPHTTLNRFIYNIVSTQTSAERTGVAPWLAGAATKRDNTQFRNEEFCSAAIELSLKPRLTILRTFSWALLLHFTYPIKLAPLNMRAAITMGMYSSFKRSIPNTKNIAQTRGVRYNAPQNTLESKGDTSAYTTGIQIIREKQTQQQSKLSESTQVSSLPCLPETRIPIRFDHSLAHKTTTSILPIGVQWYFSPSRSRTPARWYK